MLLKFALGWGIVPKDLESTSVYFSLRTPYKGVLSKSMFSIENSGHETSSFFITPALGETKADYDIYKELYFSPIVMILFGFCFDSRIPGNMFLYFRII
jgi:hypothetical protein